MSGEFVLGRSGGNGGNNGNGGNRLVMASWREVKPEIEGVLTKISDGKVVETRVAITHVRESHGLKVLIANGREFCVGLDIIVTSSVGINRLRDLVGRQPATRKGPLWKSVTSEILVNRVKITHVRQNDGLWQVLTITGRTLQVDESNVPNPDDLMELKTLASRQPIVRQGRQKEHLRRPHFTGPQY